MLANFQKVYSYSKLNNIHVNNYLIFNIFLNNKSIEFLLKKAFSKFSSFKIYRCIENNQFYASVEFDLKNYSYVKDDMFGFLAAEDFNFVFVGVLVNNSLIEKNFFEQNFSIRIDKYENIEELFYILYVDLISRNSLTYKFIFIFYYIILIIQNYLKINVYYTSGGF